MITVHTMKGATDLDEQSNDASERAVRDVGCEVLLSNKPPEYATM